MHNNYNWLFIEMLNEEIKLNYFKIITNIYIMRLRTYECYLKTHYFVIKSLLLVRVRFAHKVLILNYLLLTLNYISS